MRNIFRKIAIVLIISNCSAGESSFFMSEEESKEVFNILNKRQKSPESSLKELFVSGIFYVDETNWTIWINDIPYSSIGQQKDFSIDAVSESGVYLTSLDGSSIFLSVLVK
ncbi:MAG: hypothetical protein LBU35_01130 [Holosporales bacterium]|jgi:hypothetical protein|nr:hypothetical protein [Holosporales bacterium]